MKSAQHAFDLTPTPVLPATVAALASGNSIVVYGAGAIAAELIRLLRTKGINISHVIDAKVAGRNIEGCTALSPEAWEITPAMRAHVPLVIGIFNCFVDLPALRRSLSAQGWKHIIEYTEVHAVWPKELGDHFWLTDRAQYQKYSAEINEVDALWADDYSRQLYREIIKFRCTGDQAGLRPPHSESQYFPRNVPAWKTPLRLIDCGAFDGDTVRSLQVKPIAVEAVAAFEPDAANFAKLSATLDAWTNRAPREKVAFPCGTWSNTCQLQFDAGNGAGSGISQSGKTVIQCVSIDEALPGFQPTLIKMDIEGAEINTLQGANKTIKRCRPGLAVCVYHKPDDLWRIPLLIENLRINYKIYLDLHMHSGFDLVMYAIAQN